MYLLMPAQRMSLVSAGGEQGAWSRESEIQAPGSLLPAPCPPEKGSFTVQV
jgi:hypothetical protein